MIRAGRLHHRIVLLAYQRTPSTHGFTEDWVEHASVWAEREDQGGSEFMTQGAELTKARAVFSIRWRDDLSAAMRVRSNGTDFDVIAINEIGRREGWELLCEAAS